MYYFVYAFLYLLSLLPFFILYLLSDAIVFLLYRVFKYRRQVVLNNLRLVFPEKSMEEHNEIAKRFYRNLADTFVEMIKLISISNKALEKRNTGDFAVVDELAKRGKNIQLHAGHQFNWEYGSLCLSRSIKTIPTYAVYTPLKNQAMEKIFLNMRQRYGTKFIKSSDFRAKRDEIAQGRFAFFLAADQNPGYIPTAYWQYYFGKAAPFITGPELRGIENNTAIVFVRSRIIKRGHYSYECTLFTENAASTGTGEITRGFRDFLEKIIKEEPHNYLWTHRRWKSEYKAEFKDRWIDTKPAPDA